MVYNTLVKLCVDICRRNGKKKLGAILQFLVTLIWIVLTSSVLIGLKDDIFKAIAFAFGSLFGSYLGSVLEEKIALGTNIFMVEIENSKSLKLIDILEKEKFNTSRVRSGNDKNTILVVTGRRKDKGKIVSLIRKIDEKAIILSEKVKIAS